MLHFYQLTRLEVKKSDFQMLSVWPFPNRCGIYPMNICSIPSGNWPKQHHYQKNPAKDAKIRPFKYSFGDYSLKLMHEALQLSFIHVTHSPQCLSMEIFISMTSLSADKQEFLSGHGRWRWLKQVFSSTMWIIRAHTKHTWELRCNTMTVCVGRLCLDGR